MNFKRKASLLMAMVFIVNSLSVALATDTGIPQINEDNTTSG